MEMGNVRGAFCLPTRIYHVLSLLLISPKSSLHAYPYCMAEVVGIASERGELHGGEEEEQELQRVAWDEQEISCFGIPSKSVI